MISDCVQELLLEEKEKLFIPAEQVAVLEEDHTLAHALLVLTHVRYSVIPVVNRENKLTGLISLAMILHAIAGLNELDMNQLHHLRVVEAMKTDFSVITEQTEIEVVLNELIDQSFLCITNEERDFLGIVTRKEILKRVNYLVHELHRKYEFIEKS